jgi:hypothetical protein
MLAEKLKNTEGIVVRDMIFSHGISDAATGCDGVTLMGILVPLRDELGIRVQEVLTAFGCVIRTRLGVNEVYFGESAGLIILELAGDKQQFVSLEKALREIDDLAIGRICFPG